MQTRRSSFPRTSPNKLLASLPVAEYRRLVPLLHPVSLPFQHVPLKPTGRLSTIYFPGDGAVSITQGMRNGRTVEVATVGNEGFVGINALFKGERWLAGAVVKVPDRAAQGMSAKAFRYEMNRRGPFARAINRYASGFVALLMRSAACNALHSVDQRCARWLLTTRDHAGRNDFPLTQEFLAAMLGVRRPSVTLAFAELQRRRFIDYGHRRIVIVDRAALESASCECYTVVKRHLGRALS